MENDRGIKATAAADISSLLIELVADEAEAL